MTRLKTLSFLDSGMVCTMPTAKPMMQPIAVEMMAMSMVLPAPRR